MSRGNGSLFACYCCACVCRRSSRRRCPLRPYCRDLHILLQQAEYGPLLLWTRSVCRMLYRNKKILVFEFVVFSQDVLFYNCVLAFVSHRFVFCVKIFNFGFRGLRWSEGVPLRLVKYPLDFTG